MFSASRFRLVLLGGAMVCLVGMISWAAGTSWIKLRDIRTHVRRDQLATTRYQPERLRTLLISTTLTLFSFEISDRPEDRQKLDARYRELDAWVEATKSALRTNEEAAIFREIEAARARYIADTRALAEANPVEEPKAVMIDRLAQIEGSAEQLLALSDRLATARDQAPPKTGPPNPTPVGL